MTTQTISIKFADQATQARRLRRLQEFCGQLLDAGYAKQLKVQAIFPGHQDPLRAALFTVEVDGARNDLSERFTALPEIEYAQAAPQRRVLLKSAS